MVPLREAARTEPIISQDDIRTIFSTIEIVVATNLELLEGIQGRITTWHPNQTIGDVFITMAAFMKVYTNYVKNFNNALSTIQVRGLFFTENVLTKSVSTSLSISKTKPIQNLLNFVTRHSNTWKAMQSIFPPTWLLRFNAFLVIRYWLGDLLNLNECSNIHSSLIL